MEFRPACCTWPGSMQARSGHPSASVLHTREVGIWKPMARIPPSKRYIISIPACPSWLQSVRLCIETFASKATMDEEKGMASYAKTYSPAEQKQLGRSGRVTSMQAHALTSAHNQSKGERGGRASMSTSKSPSTCRVRLQRECSLYFWFKV